MQSSRNQISSVLRQIGDMLIDFLRSMESARACAAAVEVRVTPRAADLQRMGIDPRAFARIRRM